MLVDAKREAVPISATREEALRPPSDVVEPAPHHEHLGDLPAWVNRRSAQHKFRY